MTSFKTTLLTLTFSTFQLFTNRAAALPSVSDTGQLTDRFLPTLSNTVIPPGDHLQIFAVIESTDPPGSPSIAVSANQGDTILTLERFESLSAPTNFYWKFIDFDPSLAGAWEIVPTDSTGTGPSAFTDSLAEPELIPFVESITPRGSPVGASVEWTLPDLTDFDVEFVQVRIVQVMPRSEVFFTDFPFPVTSFEPPQGILQYGVEYVYNIELHDVEGSTENRSVAQSQPFRFVLPGDFNADGTVDAADYIVWRNGLGTAYTQADYNYWHANFGETTGSTASAPVGSFDNTSPAVPESVTALMMCLGLLALCPARRKSSRLHHRSSRGRDSPRDQKSLLKSCSHSANVELAPAGRFVIRSGAGVASTRTPLAR
jgi:hypothetical protein